LRNYLKTLFLGAWHEGIKVRWDRAALICNFDIRCCRSHFSWKWCSV